MCVTTPDKSNNAVPPGVKTKTSAETLTFKIKSLYAGLKLNPISAGCKKRLMIHNIRVICRRAQLQLKERYTNIFCTSFNPVICAVHISNLVSVQIRPVCS